MITSREIQSRESPHSLPADEEILKSGAESVAAVQSSRDVRRRERDYEGTSGHVVSILREMWLEEPLLRPPGIPGRLDYGGNVRFVVRGIEWPEDCMKRCQISLGQSFENESHAIT